MGEVIGYMNGKPVVCTTDIGEAMAAVVTADKLRRLGEYLRTAKPKTPTPKPRTWKKRRRK